MRRGVRNDPSFNGPIRFRGPDLMDSAPSIAPNGARSICGYDGGFSFGGGYDARGACVAFGANGSYKAKNEEFGWEVTDTAWAHAGGFSYLQDRQFYSDLVLGLGQYGAITWSRRSPTAHVRVPFARSLGARWAESFSTSTFRA